MQGPAVVTSSASVAATWASRATNADCEVADYSRSLAAELAVVDPDANRDDVDAMVHRRTELRPAAAAA